jgi:glycosyltransferase involved in cell wall biosynthesis
MKLVMTLLVRDEQDVLRENLEFHLAGGVDEIILMDNLSSDGTAEIAREYERAGRLHYLFQPQDDYAQGRWVTHMARRACEELRADWVIHSDADEFWWPHAGSIKDALASVDAGAVAVSVERTNFVTRADNGEPFWRRMNVRRAASVNSLGQPLPSKVAHRASPDIVIAQGNHGASFGNRPARLVAAPITILHFPVRSRAQFLNKIVKGGAAYARNTDLDPATGKTWRDLYRRYLDGTFDEAYDNEVLSDEQIARGVATGTLVRDDRLAVALDDRTRWLIGVAKESVAAGGRFRVTSDIR